MSQIETLQTFCGTESEMREWMRKPFVRDGYAYGTNGHFICRCKVDEPNTDVKVPIDPAAVFTKNFGGAFTALRAMNAPTPCHACKGPGWTLGMECPDCDGDGDFEHGGHTYACKECSGNGLVAASEADGGKRMECHACYGRGHEKGQMHALAVGNAWFAGTYLWQLSKHHGIEFAARGKDDAGSFRFGEFEGLLMPIRM